MTASFHLKIRKPADPWAYMHLAGGGASPIASLPLTALHQGSELLSPPPQKPQLTAAVLFVRASIKAAFKPRSWSSKTRLLISKH